MKYIYYFICGIMTMLTIMLTIVNEFGREFIQDYWIEQLWYGELKTVYRIITNIILFIDCVLFYFAGLFTLTKEKINNN